MTASAQGLQRFIEAQDQRLQMSGRSVYEHALGELRQGRKRTHWMWFVFPQIAGLGMSDMSRFYAISSRLEAKDYLDHPMLAARLGECTMAVLAVEGRTAAEIFGDIDAAKFRSSMTLFEAASEEPLFAVALDRFFAGERDPATLRLLAGKD